MFAQCRAPGGLGETRVLPPQTCTCCVILGESPPSVPRLPFWNTRKMEQNTPESLAWEQWERPRLRRQNQQLALPSGMIMPTPPAAGMVRCKSGYKPQSHADMRGAAWQYLTQQPHPFPGLLSSELIISGSSCCSPSGGRGAPNYLGEVSRQKKITVKSQLPWGRQQRVVYSLLLHPGAS